MSTAQAEFEAAVKEANEKRATKAANAAKLAALGYTGRTPGWVAVHEAAHAVGVVQLGHEVIEATNLSTGTTLGHVKYSATGHAQIIVALLGPLVVSFLVGDKPGLKLAGWPPSEYLYARMEPEEDLGATIKKYDVSEVHYHQLALIALKMAMDPEFMQQVALVASVLEERRDLTGAQIKALVQIAQP